MAKTKKKELKTQRPKAVVLLSGGLDSSTVLHYAKREHDVYALSFNYGQRHAVEMECAKAQAELAGVIEHNWVDISFPWGGSALTDHSMELEKDRKIEDMEKDVPNSYVAGRNIIFLAFASGYADKVGAKTIMIGANQYDFSGYPDCRWPFIEAMQTAVQLGTDSEVKIVAPLVNDTKKMIVEKAVKYGVDLSLTHSCYSPIDDKGTPCGRCDSCQLRAKGFAEAGETDPRVPSDER